MQLKDLFQRMSAPSAALFAALVISISAWAAADAGTKENVPPAAASSPASPHAETEAAQPRAAEPSLPVVVPAGEASKEAAKPQAGLGFAEGAPAAPADAGKPPVLEHIAASGARLAELGEAHGLKGILARKGEEFMFFQLAPDGEAVVAGLQADFAVSKLFTVAGSQITELGIVHGLRGLFVRDGAQFQVFYATPDGERLIPGVMWDAAGKNITREQIAEVPGAVPSAIIGDGAAASSGLREDGKKAGLDLVGKTSFGLIGPDSAPRVWMFVDPLCSYSVRAFQEVKPFAERGEVQVAVIPISVLDYETQGQSTRAALALLSKPAGSLAAAWARGDVKGPTAPEAQNRLEANMEVAGAIGLRGTPTVIWRKAGGSEGRADGVPDWNDVIASLGVVHAGQ
jgi:thiol:disulfide interchange protein DsbG